MKTHKVSFSITGRRVGNPPTSKNDLLLSVAAECLWNLIRHGYALGEGTQARAEAQRPAITLPATFTVGMTVTYQSENGFPPSDRPERMMEDIRATLEGADWVIDSESISIVSL